MHIACSRAEQSLEIIELVILVTLERPVFSLYFSYETLFKFMPKQRVRRFSYESLDIRHDEWRVNS